MISRFDDYGMIIPNSTQYSGFNPDLLIEINFLRKV